MKLGAIFTTLAFTGIVGVVAAIIPLHQHEDWLQVAVDDAIAAQQPRDIQKRDAYTCYGATDMSTSDCQQVIDRIQDHGNQTFMLRSDLCLNWSQGACSVKFCAQPYVMKPVNRTADWVVRYLTSPLLDCVKGGQNAIMSDHANINSKAGTYRLHLEHSDESG